MDYFTVLVLLPFYRSMSIMEIGVISDTHGLVRPQVYEFLEGVDLILHAGDIGGMDVIIELEVIAPVRAVVGNNDMDLFGRLKEKDFLSLEGKEFHLQHIFEDIPGTNESSNNGISRVQVFGHSHRPLNERIGDTLYFNPGIAGPRRFSLTITLGRISLKESSLESQIIHLD